MKELTKKVYHSNDFDIDIVNCLTYAEIQNIINKAVAYDSWAERQQTIDMLVLCYVTDCFKGKQTLNPKIMNEVVQSGLMEEVRANVYNYNEIYVGIDYTESLQRGLKQISKDLPEMIKPLQEVVKNHETKSEE